MGVFRKTLESREPNFNNRFVESGGLFLNKTTSDIRMPKRDFDTFDDLLNYVSKTRDIIESKVPEFFKTSESQKMGRGFKWGTVEGIKKQAKKRNKGYPTIYYLDYGDVAERMLNGLSTERTTVKARQVGLDTRTMKILPEFSDQIGIRRGGV